VRQPAADDDFSGTIAVVGAGRVGATLARLWHRAGIRIGSIASRTPGHAEALAAALSARVARSPIESAEADLIVLAVPDDAIKSVVDEWRELALDGRGVIHTSGAHDRRVLSPLAAQGAQIGSLHPAFPFAAVDLAVERLPGSVFAVEAVDEPLRGWLIALVKALDGHVLEVSPGGKALYHAALVFASNYTVTLYSLADRLLAVIGAEPESARAALDGLLAGTIANLRERGIPDALTGPLVRADLGTLRAHLAALRAVDPALADLYAGLARASYPMLTQRGVDTASIENTFTQADS
jgi:predicted short-subunit dehydrogenase-like oxidoreductase (DUF2520 family)